MVEKTGKIYAFFTDEVIFESVEKKGEKNYYITGYISTKERDLLNDVVTDNCMSDMLQQILKGNIKLDVEHESWKTENPNLIPIGRIVEAKKDEKGIFIKAKLNKAHSKFKEVWNSIKDGFIDAFSIAYKPIKYTYKMVDGVKTRLLYAVKLLNVALTGNPVNESSRLYDVFVKSLNDLEEDKMAEETEKKEVPGEDKPAEPADKPASAPEEPAKEADKPVEASAEAENTEVKSRLDALEKSQADFQKSVMEELKNLKKILTESPVLKAEQKSIEVAKQVSKEAEKDVNPLDLL